MSSVFPAPVSPVIAFRRGSMPKLAGSRRVYWQTHNTNTTAMQRQSSIPQLCDRNAGHPYVDGHCLHVETVAGDTVSMSAEEFVAPGCTVAADYINLKIGIPECGSQVVEEVEYPGIVLVNFTSAVIAQKTGIEFVEAQREALELLAKGGFHRAFRGRGRPPRRRSATSSWTSRR